MSYVEHDIEWTPEKTSRLWDYYATNPSIRSQYFGAQAGQAVAALIDRTVGFASLGNILDLSCGLGDVLAACRPYLSRRGRLHGLDFSAASVDAVQKRFKEAVPPVDVRHVSSFPTSFSEETFDLIIATEVVEHLDDAELEAMLRECCRLPAPGGYVTITTPNEEDYDAAKVCCPDCGCIFHRWQHRRTWTAATLRELMEKHDFETVLAAPIAWGTVEVPGTPKWRTVVRRLIAPLRAPPAQTGLVYIGRKTVSRPESRP